MFSAQESPSLEKLNLFVSETIPQTNNPSWAINIRKSSQTNEVILASYSKYTKIIKISNFHNIYLMKGEITLLVYDCTYQKELALEFTIPFESLHEIGNAKFEDFEALPVNSFLFKSQNNSVWTTKHIYDVIRNQYETDDSHILFKGPLLIDKMKYSNCSELQEPEKVYASRPQLEQSFHTSTSFSTSTLNCLQREDLEEVCAYAKHLISYLAVIILLSPLYLWDVCFVS